MEITDLTTSGGVAAGTLFLIEVLKKIIVNNDYVLKEKTWYPALVNLATLVGAMAISIGAYYVLLEKPDGFTLQDALLNGLIAFFITIGGYEPLVNILRGLRKKPNK
jgi:hypothetical protein